MAQYNNQFKSSVADLEAFEKSVIWSDVKQELINWETRITEELLNATFDPASGQMTMDPVTRALYDEGLRGSHKALQEMREIITVIKDIVLQNKEENVNGS